MRVIFETKCKLFIQHLVLDNDCCIIRNVGRTEIILVKPVYLGFSILKISKILMYEFWYDCIKPKYQDNAKLCYMDTDSFIIYIKTQDLYEDIANDVEKRFDEVNRPLPTGKNKKVIGLMKD